MHVQVCTINRYFDISIHIAYTLATGCAHALMYAQSVHSALGDEGGEGLENPDGLNLGIRDIRDDVKLAQLVRAWDCQSRCRRFDSSKSPKNRDLESTWIGAT